MSQMEYNKGKLIPHNELNEEFAEYLASEQGETDFRPYLSFLDMVMDDPYHYLEGLNLTLIDGKLYSVEFEVKRGECYGFEKASVNEDGSIDFETWHYNGSACWEDCVEDALRNGDKVHG